MDEEGVELPPVRLPGYESRIQARMVIALSVLLAVLVAFLYVASPGIPTPMSSGREPDLMGVAFPFVGPGLNLVGLAWMVRIYRAAVVTEADGNHWRYRD